MECQKTEERWGFLDKKLAPQQSTERRISRRGVASAGLWLPSVGRKVSFASVDQGDRTRASTLFYFFSRI